VRGTPCAFCCVVLLTSSFLSAEPWCTIELGVKDGLGVAVAGVEVHAEGPGLSEVLHRETGPDGAVVLLGLSPGNFRLEMTREGYQWLEVQDVRCKPESVVRLVVTLERAEGDEVVILPSGPSVDPEGIAVGNFRSRVALESLPESRTEGSAEGVGQRQLEAQAFEGVIGTGRSERPGPRLGRVSQRPERGFHGRVAIDVGGGLQARATGTRGEVTDLDDLMRARISLGSLPESGRLGTFVALEVKAAGLESQVAFDDGASEEQLDRGRQWDQDTALAYGVIDWLAAENHRIDLRLNWDRQQQENLPSSLHVAPESPVPGGDSDSLDRAIRLEWNALVSDTQALRLEGGFSDTTDRWMPEGVGPMIQDQSPDGSWSGGLGNGLWSGDGGVAAFKQTVDDLHAEAGLEWSVGSGHRLALESSWRREGRDLRYPGSVDPVGLGVRTTYRGEVAERRDVLVLSGAGRGVEEVWRFGIQDAWRVGSGLTMILGLEMTDLRFDADGGRPGYSFGVDDTLSPRVGLVWDFEGEGRSRVWVHWARFRQGPGEAVKWRLAGAVDIETRFVDESGNSWERAPDQVGVDPGLEPSTIDETVFGLEYELLSNLVVGAAGILRRSTGGLAILTEDGGETLNLGTASGPGWTESLKSENAEGWIWMRKRLANGWQAEIQLGWRRSRGAWPGPSAFDLVDLDREYLSDVVSPAALESAWGPLPDDRRWHGEINGSWLFGIGLSLGGRLSYQSGAPVSRLGALDDGLGLDRRFLEHRGSAGRTPELWRLDFVGSWPFEVGKGRLEAFAEVSNILNSQEAIRLDERWSLLDEGQAVGLDPGEQRTPGTWGELLLVQRPLELRVGLAYSW